MARRTRTARRSVAREVAPPKRDGDQAATRSRTVWVAGAFIALAVGALELRTAARDIVFGDSPELTGAAITLGVAHPPGYPIWTVLAHAFTLVPIGTLPFRVSAFTVVASVACVVIVYVTAWRLTRNVIAAGTSAVVLALAPVVWEWSVVPEVFSLNNAMAAGLIALLIEWHRTRAPRYFVLAALAGGLAMANHQTIALLGPAILWLMWHHRRALRGGGLVARAALASIAGLLPYLYLPLASSRGPAWSWGDISSISDLLGHVLRTSYGTAQLVSEGRFQGGSIVDRVVALLGSFTPVEATGAVLGAFLLFRRDRALFWFFVTAFAVAGPAFVGYSNINISSPLTRSVLERFFLLPHVILAPLTALGLIAIGNAARERFPRSRRALDGAVAALAVATSVAVAGGSLGAIDESDNHFARRFAQDILATTRPSAILFGGGDAVVMPIQYLLVLEGARPDVTFVQIPLLRADWYVRQLHRDHPGLVLRYPRFDGVPGTMRAFIEPNDPTRFDVIGGLLDDTMATTHTLIPRGLVSEFRLKEERIDLDALAGRNEALLASYRIPTVAAASGRAWDRVILGDYASPAYNVALLFEQQRLYPRAREWYDRALAIDPDFIEARAARAKLPP